MDSISYAMLLLKERFIGSFVLCSILCVVLHVLSGDSAETSRKNTSANQQFRGFQWSYLIVYTLAMFSDWLQGPYVYELYVSYGFSQQEIAELFVCGFGSSMIVGTFVGGLADKYGRRFMCVMYCVSYIIGCCTKLVPEYWTLMLGRFLSGISTSLLFSVFESWMVCEHNKRGYDDQQLASTFSRSTFGNGLAAVVAGLIANTFAEAYGYVAPFMVALVPLLLTALIVFFSWDENFGNQDQNTMSSFTKAFDLLRNDPKICTLAFAQSCFEGAMYTFVFMWTPALKSVAETEAELDGKTLEGSTSQYLGVIFSCFMVCVMMGSSIFKIMNTGKSRLYNLPIALHCVSFLMMGAVTLFYDNKLVVYFCFLLFEISVGVFYPAYGVIKSEKLPEEIRSSIMNIFRIPLNAFVVLLLLKIKFLSPPIVFAVCTFTHGVALVCYLLFYSRLKRNENDLSLKNPSEVEMRTGLMSSV